MLDPQSTLQWQAKRIEELEAEVAYWRAKAQPPPDHAFVLSQRLGMTLQQARVLAALYEHKPIAKLEHLIDALATNGELDVYLLRNRISHVRAALRRHGVTDSVSSIFAVGYQLSPEAREFLSTLLVEQRKPEQGRAR